MHVGGHEGPGACERYSTGADMVGDMRAMERALKSQDYSSLRVRSVVLEGEDHLTVAPVGFTRALMAVLPASDAP